MNKFTNIPDANNFMISKFMKDEKLSSYADKYISKIESFRWDCQKELGGSILSNADRNAAFIRAIKYLNLGLEYASQDVNTSKITESKINIDSAKRIFMKASPEQIYLCGKSFFAERKKYYESLLNNTQVTVGGYRYSLINATDYEKLKRLTNIDLCEGTYAEHCQVQTSLIEKVCSIKRLLPINEFTAESFSHFGKKSNGSKGGYSDSGLVEVLFSSLLIAFLFRKKCDFLFTGGDIATKNKHLIQIMQLTTKEIHEFGQMVLTDQAKLQLQIKGNKHLLKEYFYTAARLFGINISQQHWKSIQALLEYASDKLIKDFKEFFKLHYVMSCSALPDEMGLKTGEESYRPLTEQDDYNIKKYWGKKVLFIEAEQNEINAFYADNDNIDINKLAESSLEFIVSSTNNFLAWSFDKQNELFSKLNANRFINEKTIRSDLIRQFLKIITFDKSEQIEDSNSFFLARERQDWLKLFFDKINWEHVPAQIIFTLWTNETIHARNLLYEKRDQFKITLPGLKTYVENCSAREPQIHADTRLLEYMLIALVDQGKLKSRKTWVGISDSVKSVLEKEVVEKIFNRNFGKE